MTVVPTSARPAPPREFPIPKQCAPRTRANGSAGMRQFRFDLIAMLAGVALYVGLIASAEALLQ